MSTRDKISMLILVVFFTLSSTIILQAEEKSKTRGRQEIETIQQMLRHRTETLQQISMADYPSTWDDFDVTYYRIEMELNTVTSHISVTTQVGLKVLANSISEVALNFLYSPFAIDSVGLAAASYSAQNDSLYLSLDRTYTNGEIVTVQISYNGVPETPANASLPVFATFNQSGNIALFTNNWPDLARCWFPCRDFPADKADSTDMIIRVKQPLVVVSNGVLKNVIEHDDNTRTYHWHEGCPIATYSMSLAVAKYTLIENVFVTSQGDSVPVDYYVFPGDEALANQAFAVTLDQMEFLEERLGTYPFCEEKYGYAQYDGMEVWAYMENQTIGNLHTGVMGTASNVVDMYTMTLISRQYFGNCVTFKDWGNYWLSDGFSAYTSSLWAEYVRGSGEFWLWMDSNKQNVINTREETVYRPPGESFFSSATFDKAAWIFHMLRCEYGDSLFFVTLKEFGEQFKHSNANTEDFQKVWEETTVDDLEWFFQQWIYEPGYPILNWDWAPSEIGASQYEIRVLVKQVQDVGPHVFKLPLTIQFDFAGDSERTKVFMNSRDTVFTIQLSELPNSVSIDPDQAILMECSTIDKPFQLLDWELEEIAGNGDGGWDPGETANLRLKLAYSGIDVQSVGVRLEPTSDQIQLMTDQILFENVITGDTLEAENQKFEFLANETAEACMMKFYIHMAKGGAEIQTDSIYVPLGDPNILFVDDDGGKSYEQYYLDTFIRCGAYAENWNCKEKGAPSITAEDYPVLLWSTGATRDSTLTAEEQSVIRNFLSSGGDVIIAGQNIGFDLVQNGSFEDSLFFADVLHAKFIADTGNVTVVIGQPGDPVWTGMIVSLQGKMGTPDPVSADIIQPIHPAVGLLSFGGRKDQRAGVGWIDPISGARLIYLTFGLEAVKGPFENSAELFLEKCLSWLAATATGALQAKQSITVDFQLYHNYPNPFNPSTAIRFDLPRKERVTLEIVNVLGQKVKTLIEKDFNAGSYSIFWDGKDAAGIDSPSGIYLISLRAGDKMMTRKTLKIK